QATWKFSDTVRLVGGLRYSYDKLKVFHSRVTTLTGPGIQPNFDQGVYNAYTALVATGVSPTTAAGSASVLAASNGVPFRTSTSNSNVSGKVSLQADLTPDVMSYASYTRGYKGPAYNIFYNLTGTGTNPIEPETSDAFEVGFKNKLFGGSMILNVAGFYAKYHNFQANNPDLVSGVVVTRFTNAGEVSTKGVEADLTWRPIADLNITGGIAYTDAKVVQFKEPVNAPAGSVIPKGTPLGYAPKWKGSLAADYRIRALEAFDVILGGQVNFQSSQLSLFAANEAQRFIGTIPAYALANLSLGVSSKDDKYRLTFQVRNVFDQSYAAAIINGGPAGSYRYQIPRDADRYWGVTGRVSF
ncbi:MAG: TonB-dependent receptor, partial [Sphingomonadales bacterium]|nr:TonB-dependent receptor [Sphingomonadales bacterium]